MPQLRPEGNLQRFDHLNDLTIHFSSVLFVIVLVIISEKRSKT